jgi:hypothetical protein
MVKYYKIGSCQNQEADKLFQMLILANLLSVVNKQDVFSQEYLKFINLLYL